jgi:hypothetical protein
MRALLLVLALATSLHAAGPLVEPATGTKFDREVTLDGTLFRCVGTGVRTRFFFKVYAIAFCLDAAQATPTLHAAIAQREEAFFQSLQAAPVAKAAQLVFVRDVGQKTIADAFAESLSGAPSHPSPADVDRFRAIFDRDLHAGDHLALVVRPDGTVHVLLPGGGSGAMRSPAVASAILHAWLGEDSVTPSLRDSIRKDAVQAD